MAHNLQCGNRGSRFRIRTTPGPSKAILSSIHALPRKPETRKTMQLLNYELSDGLVVVTSDATRGWGLWYTMIERSGSQLCAEASGRSGPAPGMRFGCKGARLTAWAASHRNSERLVAARSGASTLWQTGIWYPRTRASRSRVANRFTRRQALPTFSSACVRPRRRSSFIRGIRSRS